MPQKSPNLPDLMQRGHFIPLRDPTNRDRSRFRQGAHLGQFPMRAGQDGDLRPVGCSQSAQALDFGDGRLSLAAAIRSPDYLHLAFRSQVTLAKLTARRQHFPMAINPDRVFGFHPIRVTSNELVRGLGDVAGGPVVLNEVMHIGIVILPESADELHVGAAEGVNVLIVVANRQNGEFEVGIIQRLAGNSADQFVLRPVDILILIHQNILETRQQPVPDFVRLEAGESGLPAQKL